MNDMAPTDRDDTPSGARLHMGIAEQGKLYALAGDHALALHYYRTAMRLAVEARDAEVFFRHYLDCVMESLEHMGAYHEVLAYCDKAIALYSERPPPNPLAIHDLAAIHLRRGATLLKAGDREAARGSLRSAISVARSAGGTLPLAQTLLRWLDAGFQVDAQRLLAEQKRQQYFTVRRDSVDPSKAIQIAEAGPMHPGPR